MRQFYHGVCLNLAHRGARAYAPENTIAAFNRALALGADGFELDVHLSADGQLIVHHDDDLLRCTNINQIFPNSLDYFVSSFTAEQIQSLDAGSWYVEAWQHSLGGKGQEGYLNQLTEHERHLYVTSQHLSFYQSGQIRIPLLTEVLDLVEMQGCIVNIELKSLPRQYEHMSKAVLELIEHRQLQAQVMISSFDHHQLQAIRKQNADIYLGVLSSDKLCGAANYVKQLRAQAYHPGCYGEADAFGFDSELGNVDGHELRACRDAGLDVNVWTANHPTTIDTLIQLGATAVMSDMPNRVTEAIAECAK